MHARAQFILNCFNHHSFSFKFASVLSVSPQDLVICTKFQFTTVFSFCVSGPTIYHAMFASSQLLCPPTITIMFTIYLSCISSSLQAVPYIYFNMIQCLSQISQIVACLMSHKDSKSKLDLLREQVKAEVGPPA